MSIFYVSDPVLDVADGHGTLTATVQGYASSVDDPDTWEPVEPATVTLADLPDVDLSDERGLTVTPAYLGVRVDGVGQVTGDQWTGSFPQSFVDYMDRLGTAAFWLLQRRRDRPVQGRRSRSASGSTPAAEQPEPTPTAAADQGADRQPGRPAAGDRDRHRRARSRSSSPRPRPSYSRPWRRRRPRPRSARSRSPPSSWRPPLPRPRPSRPKPSPAPTPVWWLGGGLLLAAALTLLVPFREGISMTSPVAWPHWPTLPLVAAGLVGVAAQPGHRPPTTPPSPGRSRTTCSTRTTCPCGFTSHAPSGGATENASGIVFGGGEGTGSLATGDLHLTYDGSVTFTWHARHHASATPR